jgi:hypothetical protein
MSLEKDGRKVAIIVASGPSAAPMRTMKVNSKEIAVIAVNGALDWCRHFSYWFTLDPSRVNRKRMRTYRHNAKYFIAYPKGQILIPSYVTRLERYSPVVNPFDASKNPCAIGLNTAANVINSGNSAYGALGLAYHLGFEKVALIGVDANDEERIDGGNSRDLSHLPELFESAMHQIDIVNLGDMKSEIPTMNLQDFMAGVPHLSSKMIRTDGLQAALDDQQCKLQEYEARKLEMQRRASLNAISNDHPQNHDTNQISPDDHLVLHEDLAVPAEGPGTHFHLPWLTTTL